MYPGEKANCIIFDHDGTLINSFTAVILASNKVAEANGFSPYPDAVVISGMIHPTPKRMGILCKTDDPEEQEALACAFYREMISPEALSVIKPYPGIAEMLNTLYDKGFTLAIMSNNSGEIVRSYLAHCGLSHYFTQIIGDKDLAGNKPEPDHSKEVCALLGVLPEQCWLIGDSHVDQEAATLSGMFSGLVNWGVNSAEINAELPADTVFSTPKQICDFFTSHEANV